MSITKANGINIYYEIHGEGEPLVLIQGYGSNSSSWISQVMVFSRKYKVITFDNRGTGRSDKPDISYTTKTMAEDVKGLLDILDIDAAHICGASMGGLIAQEFAINSPKQVISLILACTHCGGTHAITRGPVSNENLFDEERMKQITERQRMEGQLPFLFSPGFIKTHPNILDNMMAQRLEYPTPLHGYKRQAEAIMHHDTYNRLPQIKAPTLIIHGAADPGVLVANARILSSRIPDAELVILKGLRHAFVAEKPEEVHRIILDFLRRHPRSI